MLNIQTTLAKRRRSIVIIVHDASSWFTIGQFTADELSARWLNWILDIIIHAALHTMLGVRSEAGDTKIRITDPTASQKWCQCCLQHSATRMTYTLSWKWGCHAHEAKLETSGCGVSERETMVWVALTHILCVSEMDKNEVNPAIFRNQIYTPTVSQKGQEWGQSCLPYSRIRITHPLRVRNGQEWGKSC